MSAMDPSGPSQPGQGQVYNTAGNAASKEPQEQVESKSSGSQGTAQVDQRIPSKQTYSSDEAKPTSKGQGIRGAGPGEDPNEISEQDQGKTATVDAEQMGAPGEGRVADAVKGKSNIGGGEPGLENDLDRKKAEQAPAREAQKAKQKEEIDVGGILGQRGGPANPVS